MLKALVVCINVHVFNISASKSLKNCSFLDRPHGLGHCRPGNLWLIINAPRLHFLKQHASTVPYEIKEHMQEYQNSPHKTLIRPILTYGAETWVVSKQDEHRLSIFDRKILRRIYDPLIDGGRWRIRTHQELYQLCDENDIVKFCKLNGLIWAGRVIRQDDDFSRIVLLSQPGGKRPRRRPRLR